MHMPGVMSKQKLAIIWTLKNQKTKTIKLETNQQSKWVILIGMHLNSLKMEGRDPGELVATKASQSWPWRAMSDPGEQVTPPCNALLK